MIFNLDVKGIKNIKKVGLRGEKPLGWNFYTEMKLGKDSIYSAIIDFESGYKFVQYKFTINEEFELKDKEIILIGDSDFQLDQINDILRNKLTKAAVDARFLDVGKSTKIGGDKVKQINTVRNGIESDLAKKIQVLLKGSKIKVQGAIQEEKVRVTGGKRDDLQAAMALIKAENADFPLSFNNFRD